MQAQRGFSIVAAVFILVVLAGLGAFIASTSGGQQLALGLDVQSARAQQAAKAGIEWAAYQVLKVPAAPGNFAQACEAASYGAPSAPTALSGLPGLAEFRIEITCGSALQSEGALPSYRIYQIQATACNAAACPAPNPGLGYVEHQLVVRVTQ